MIYWRVLRWFKSAFPRVINRGFGSGKEAVLDQEESWTPVVIMQHWAFPSMQLRMKSELLSRGEHLYASIQLNEFAGLLFRNFTQIRIHTQKPKSTFRYFRILIQAHSTEIKGVLRRCFQPRNKIKIQFRVLRSQRPRLR